MQHTRPVQTTGTTPRCIYHWLCPACVISRRLDGVHSPRALHGTNDLCRRSPSTLPSTLPTVLYAFQFKSASWFPKVSSKGPKHYPIFSARLFMHCSSIMSPRLDLEFVFERSKSTFGTVAWRKKKRVDTASHQLRVRDGTACQTIL
jgi:hypothetical protein